jgi:hypothetical protein
MRFSFFMAGISPVTIMGILPALSRALYCQATLIALHLH